MMKIAIAKWEQKLFLLQSSILFETKSLIVAEMRIKVVCAYGKFFKNNLVLLYTKANFWATSSSKE